MANVFSLIVFTLLSCSFFSYAEIRVVSSLNSIEQEINSSPKETLVLLDIGGTLLAYPDAVLHPSNEAWKQQWFQKHFPNISKEEKIALDKIVLGTLHCWKLLDAKWIELVVQAKSHGIKVVAFSKVTMDPSQRGVRAKVLRDLGIPLQDHLPELSKGNSYEYAEGVIETEYPLKGPVLKEVLDALKMYPKKIIFVDDRMKQIESVHDMCCKLELPCTAFHYVPTINVPPLNEEVADYQLSTLIHKHRWIHESQARFELERCVIK